MSNSEYTRSESKQLLNDLRIDKFVIIGTYLATIGIITYLLTSFFA